MNNNAMTVKLWDEITEVQSEALNGGSGGSGKYTFLGPIGNFQLNEGDGVQVNTSPINQQVFNSFRPGRRYHH